MCASSYTFTGEVDGFDIDDYIGHLGWNGPKLNTLKIYTQAGSPCFYLHDEVHDRLYAFTAAEPERLNTTQELEHVVMLFREWSQE
jgi:hypothetical protein